MGRKLEIAKAEQGIFPARLLSRLFSPLAVILIVLVLAGISARLNLFELVLLVVGVAALPGLVYKGSKNLLRRRSIPDYWRLIVVTILMLAAVIGCFLLSIPDPVPATVAGLFFGNVALAVWRKKLNVSAHVSVLTFAVVWAAYEFGTNFLWLLIISPLMIFSRVNLKEHSFPEALTGAALGLATFGITLVVRNWS